MLGIVNSKRRKGAGRRGTELIEFTLVMLPFLAFTFLLIDTGWAIFKRATLQFAVREGCRYAITNQVRTDLKLNTYQYGLIDSVKAIVQSNALGVLGTKPSGPGWDAIHIRFYPASGKTMTTEIPPPADCKTKGPNADAVADLVEVSVENYQSNPLAPLLRNATPLNFTARSTDRMESVPRTGAVALLTCTGP